MQCKYCGRDNLFEARFCSSCGKPLSEATEQLSEIAVAAPVPLLPVAGQKAGFWIRFAAWIIDEIIISVLSTFLVFAGFLGAFQVSGLVVISIMYIISFGVWILYWWLFTGLRGQTLGKMAVGIKVVDEKGNKPGLRRAAFREILGKIVSAIVIYFGFLWIIRDGQKQGWHDKIAGTYVVRV
jgi:uncharacterized RDD family membrane protein YckC